MAPLRSTGSAATSLPASLQGQLLIAMPHIEDPRFHQAVLVMLEHDAKGAMGLMVNRQLDDLNFEELLQQIKTGDAEVKDKDDLPAFLPDLPIHFGGPMEVGRGFILHTSDVMLPHSKIVQGSTAVTTSLDMLYALAQGRGPHQAMLALGYAGWGAGQLETELAENTWLHAPFNPELIFKTPLELRWDAALASVGVSAGNLSTASGRA